MQQQLPVPAPLPPVDISHFPPWQRHIISLVQRGVKLYDAAQRSNVSLDTVSRYAENSEFGRALADADAGVVVLGPDHVRQLAIAHAYHLVDHFSQQATDATVRPRDQQGAGRIVLEGAGVLGHGPGTAIQINVGQSQAAWDQWHARGPVAEAELRRLPAPDSGAEERPEEA